MRAAPDGYTLNLGQLGSHVMNGAALTLPYDLLKDLDPVSMVAANPQVIAARSGFPANNLKELIAWLKANPDKASVATVGAGSPSHVSAVYFANATGTKLNLVPYRGGGPAMQDLVANQVDLMIIQVAEAVAQSQAGRLKTFAVTSKTRLPGAPDIPTVDEAGLPGMHISFWHGLWMPRGVPKDILARSTPRWSRRSPTETCARGSPPCIRRSRRANSRRPRGSRRIRRPRSRSGGRSSRRPASRRSDQVRGMPVAAGTRRPALTPGERGPDLRGIGVTQRQRHRQKNPPFSGHFSAIEPSAGPYRPTGTNPPRSRAHPMSRNLTRVLMAVLVLNAIAVASTMLTNASATTSVDTRRIRQ